MAAAALIGGHRLSPNCREIRRHSRPIPAIWPRGWHGRRASMSQKEIAEDAGRPVHQPVPRCSDWHFYC